MDGSSAKYFSEIKLQAENINNIRIQSILNNYSLSISDRIAITKKIRSADDTNYLEKIVLISTGKKWKVPGIVGNTRTGMGVGNDIPQETKKGLGGYAPLLDENEKTSQTVNNTMAKLEQEVLNETGLSPFPIYHFDPHFAAGMISTGSFAHSLLCQSYFRPFVIDLVKVMTRDIIHLPIPVGFEGKTYGEVFAFLLDGGYLAVGLYRRRSGGASLPYVYTNPKMNEQVSGDDLVFALYHQQH